MPIAEDLSTPLPVYVSSSPGVAAGQSVTTARFSPPGNSLLTAMITCHTLAGIPTITISDTGGHVWLGKVSAGSNAFSAIYTCQLASAPGPITVTAANTSSQEGTLGLAVRVDTGASSSQGTAAAQPTQNTGNTTPQVSISTTAPASWVYVCATGGGPELKVTPVNSLTTLTLINYQDYQEGSSLLFGKQVAPTGTPESTVLGWVWSLPHTWSIAALEILSADVFLSSFDTGVGHSDTIVAKVTAKVPSADTGAGGEPRNRPTGAGAVVFVSSADTASSQDNLSYLSDSFPGTSLNTVLWGSTGTVAVSGGVLTVTDTANTAALTGVESVATYSLANGQFRAQLVSAGTQQPYTQSCLQVIVPSGNALLFFVNNNVLTAQKEVGGTYTVLGSTAYSAPAMSLLRIREMYGITYFEYAAVATGPWTALWSGPDPFSLTAVRACLVQGMYSPVDPQTSSQWDAALLAPAQEGVRLSLLGTAGPPTGLYGTWWNVGDTDSGSGTEQTAGPPVLGLSGRESAAGSEVNAVPYTYTWISSIVLGYAQEGFSLDRCAVLATGSGAESMHLHGAQSISLVPDVTTSDMRADDDEFGTWYTLNKAALTVTSGFLSFNTIAQLCGTSVALSGLSPNDYYGLPLWTQYQHNQPAVPMAFRMMGRNTYGNVRTLTFVLYKVQLSVLDFTGLMYKDGLGVSYAGTVLFSSTDEHGNALAGPEIGRIVSVPGTQTGTIAPVQFAGT